MELTEKEIIIIACMAVLGVAFIVGPWIIGKCSKGYRYPTADKASESMTKTTKRH